MRTLMIYPDDADQAFEILGDKASLYRDHVGDSDGLTWLPSDGPNWLPSAEIDPQLAARVAEAGYGEIVEVCFASDAGMLSYLGMTPIPNGNELEEKTVQLMKAAADDRTAGWAHFNDYGTIDSLWVFIPQTD